MKQYLTNLGLWARGIRWCFSRRYYTDERPDVPVYVFPEEDCPPGVDPEVWGIRYKDGWGPWRFLPIYCSTMLVGVLAGFGVVSISKVLWERSEVMSWGGIRHQFEEQCLTRKPPCRFAYPLSRFLCRLIDWLFLKLLRQENHCAGAGPRLWGSRSAWE